jgi:hypothetical protein
MDEPRASGGQAGFLIANWGDETCTSEVPALGRRQVLPDAFNQDSKLWKKESASMLRHP